MLDLWLAGFAAFVKTNNVGQAKMKNKKVVVVTGSNTGLGYSLVKGLCTSFGENAVVYLTARDENRGRQAVERLHKLGLRPQFHLLDVTSDESVDHFSKHIKDLYGGVDILFHNAAARISPDLPQREQVETFINTNNLGTTRIIKAFYPLVRDNSKFIIVASSFGTLTRLDKKLHHKFDFTRMGLDDVDSVMNEYVTLVKEGVAADRGWPEWMNIPSKIGQVASMKILARMIGKEQAKARYISVLAVCPGLMDTEASRPWFKDMSQAKQPDDAAVDLLWIVSQEEWSEERYGILLQYRKVIPWSDEID
jgi:carbonyl reductase 1